MTWCSRVIAWNSGVDSSERERTKPIARLFLTEGWWAPHAQGRGEGWPVYWKYDGPHTPFTDAQGYPGWGLEDDGEVVTLPGGIQARKASPCPRVRFRVQPGYAVWLRLESDVAYLDWYLNVEHEPSAVIEAKLPIVESVDQSRKRLRDARERGDDV